MRSVISYFLRYKKVKVLQLTWASDDTRISEEVTALGVTFSSMGFEVYDFVIPRSI
jgi:hypothetical protein